MLLGVSDRRFKLIEQAALSCESATTDEFECKRCCYDTYGAENAPRAPVTPWQNGARGMCESFCEATHRT